MNICSWNQDKEIRSSSVYAFHQLQLQKLAIFWRSYCLPLFLALRKWGGGDVAVFALLVQKHAKNVSISLQSFLKNELGLKLFKWMMRRLKNCALALYIYIWYLDAMWISHFRIHIFTSLANLVTHQALCGAVACFCFSGLQLQLCSSRTRRTYGHHVWN